jgi:hydroxypyruvate isomerase
MKRREAIKSITLSAGAYAFSTGNKSFFLPSGEKGIKHSVCKWCYNDIPLETLCEASGDIGLSSIELLTPGDWPILKKYNLTCAMGTESWISITDCFNDAALHSKLQKNYPPLLESAAKEGIPNIICFSGNRHGMADGMGLEHCAVGLEPVVKYAEKLGVMVAMELLNSKVNHKDYQCDHTEWGVALVEKIGSPNFKLLYDIYHMQIMEGDIIATIEKYSDYIVHFHTGGVPGRNEIDESQELYYPAIMKAIKETGYNGYVGQEFIPLKKDKLGSLKQGVTICSV